MAISIKVSEENYRNLSMLSGRLQEMLKKPVSLNEAISFLYKKKGLSELAGSWKMSDGEVRDFQESLKRGWKRWKMASA
ncbi:MAG TPA: hypothetical protein VJH95_04845 [Candidatus Nanoarchaeia archaeon]|nr:hypothetical protein [Candidatus Nanoarchaeia archaeon]